MRFELRRKFSELTTRDRFWQLLLCLMTSAVLFPAISLADGSNTDMKIEKTSFGKTQDGQEISLFTCVNGNGLVLKMIDYGAIVVSLETPDRDGKLANIT